MYSCFTYNITSTDTVWTSQYSGLQVPRKLATEMGREKEVFEPWSSSRVRRKPGTHGHPTENTTATETVPKRKEVSKKPPVHAKGMKRTAVAAITPSTAAKLPQQLHNGESSGVRKN